MNAAAHRPTTFGLAVLPFVCPSCGGRRMEQHNPAFRELRAEACGHEYLAARGNADYVIFSDKQVLLITEAPE